jgi:hypothetical protein
MSVDVVRIGWVNYLSNAIKYGGRPPRVEGRLR